MHLLVKILHNITKPWARQMWPPIYMDDGTIRRGPHADVIGRWRT
jgi:hypothetical protein